MADLLALIVLVLATSGLITLLKFPFLLKKEPDTIENSIKQVLRDPEAKKRLERSFHDNSKSLLSGD